MKHFSLLATASAFKMTMKGAYDNTSVFNLEGEQAIHAFKANDFAEVKTTF